MPLRERTCRTYTADTPCLAWYPTNAASPPFAGGDGHLLLRLLQQLRVPRHHLGVRCHECSAQAATAAAGGWEAGCLRAPVGAAPASHVAAAATGGGWR